MYSPKMSIKMSAVCDLRIDFSQKGSALRNVIRKLTQVEYATGIRNIAKFSEVDILYDYKVSLRKYTLKYLQISSYDLDNLSLSGKGLCLGSMNTSCAAVGSRCLDSWSGRDRDK